MDAEAALIYSITQYLRGDTLESAEDDAALMNVAGGAFYAKADENTPLPYCVWEWHYDTREFTFGHVAGRGIYFRVKAAYGDAGGANFANGNAIVERVSYLLDGGERANSDRVKAGLNALLASLGWQCTLCRQKNFIPPHDETIGEDKITSHSMMGHLYELQLQAA